MSLPLRFSMRPKLLALILPACLCAEVASVGIGGGEQINPLAQLPGGRRPDKMPRALSLIHTAGDAPDKIDAAAAARSLAVNERALRLLDSPRP